MSIGEAEYVPEWRSSQVRRGQVNSAIHSMAVSDSSEWDEEMHPQVDRLQAGEVIVLRSDAFEYLKVAKTSSDHFDLEYGTFDPS